MKILVSDANSKISLGIIRSFNPKIYKVEVFSVYKKPLCYYSKYCKNINVLPEYESKFFEKEFINLLKKKKFDFIIPVQFKSFLYLSKLKKKILKYSNINCESFDKISKVSSKYYVSEVVNQLKLDSLKKIKTYKLSNFKNLQKIQNKIRYPIVIKPKNEQGGMSHNVYYSDSINDTKKIYKKIKGNNNLILKDYIVQKKINGVGRGFFSYSKNGKCLIFFQHQRLRELPISGGASVAAVSIYDKKLAEIGKTIVKKLKWNGVLMLEFKFFKGNYYLIEANPKFWGSLDLAIASGVNFPLIMINSKKYKNLGYTRNLKYHWPFNGGANVASKNFILFKSFIFDLLNPKVKSNIWLIKDPISSLYLIYKFLKNTLFYGR